MMEMIPVIDYKKKYESMFEDIKNQVLSEVEE